MKTKTLLTLCALLCTSLAAQTRIPAPEWAKDLVIYEIAPKAYTSPNGPETGTFNSLKERMPYLSELGINGIWLSGHNLADSSHFFNVWTQFAVLRQDSLEPSLGSPADFKALVDEAHKYGIKVFLDIISHGLMPQSSLVREHPEWFRGGSYRMVDFDWYGNHPDLDQWWVDTHTDYVTRYGIDGFRVDVCMYRTDLWNRIREKAAQAGHPIFIFAEGWEITDGASDMLQRLNRLAESIFEVNDWNKTFTNVGEHYRDFEQNNAMFRLTGCKVLYEDGTIETGSIAGGTKLSMRVPQKPDPMNHKPQKVKVYVGGMNPEKPIRSIEVYAADYLEGSSVDYRDSTSLHYPMAIPSNYNPKPMGYKVGKTSNQPVSMLGLDSICLEVTTVVPDKILLSTQISSHDNGWDRFPLGKNPYVAEGSRCIMGYSCLLTPSVPLFMAGEEFNSDYMPLPRHTRDLYAERDKPGTGTWLYANMIQWDQLSQPAKKAMLEDVKRMLRIRRQESDIFYARTSHDRDFIRETALLCADSIPVPYLLFNQAKAIVVAGNNLPKTVRATLTISLENTPLEGCERYKITDLWNPGKTRIVKPEALQAFQIQLPADKTPGGGLGIWKIEPY